jgi:hypothetical protein
MTRTAAVINHRHDEAEEHPDRGGLKGNRKPWALRNFLAPDKGGDAADRIITSRAIQSFFTFFQTHPSG